MAGLFYVPGFGEADRVGTLPVEEARHAATVRRMRIGEEISITNGKGLIGHCVVDSVGHKPASLEYSVRMTHKVPKSRLIHVAVAMPKGDRQRVLLEMATQVGLDELTPLECERSVSREGANSQERWQRYCLEAMKQSRRAWLPRVNSSRSIADFFSSLSQTTISMCADAEGESIQVMESIAPEQSIAILVGPEGGFTENELTTIGNAGVRKIALGDGVLRTETAAVVVTALVRLLDAENRAEQK